MATRYQRGETVVLTTATTNSAGTATTPATSFLVTVTDPGGTKRVDAQAMTASSTGVHYYNYTLAADAILGEWRVEYVATHTGSLVTRQVDRFVVEATTIAAAWPYAVGLGEVKEHLRVTGTDEDAYIESLIAAAQSHLEHLTGRRFVNTSCTYRTDELIEGMELPFANLVSITSIAYYDADDTAQTLSSANYQADTNSEPGRVYLTASGEWPTISTNVVNPVTITYVAGYGATAANVPDALKHAIKLLVAHWYENREPVLIGSIQVSLPFTVESLIAQYKTGVYA
jgi:uncharacterized phiE125 gp8 family phage protein